MKISQRSAELPASGIRKMFELSAKFNDVINLCIGEPDFETPSNIIDAGCYALKNGYTKYVSNSGLPQLREAVALKAKNINHIDCTKENVMITNGAGQSLMSVLQCLVNPGDEVLIPDPSFPNYLGYIKLAGAKIVPIPTFEEDHFHIKAENIEPYITPKTKILLLNSPANPTGAVLQKKELQQIGELAKTFHFYIISDEPYESILYDGKEYCSIASLPGMFERTATVNSFSKSYAMTGWRVGYTIGPTNLIHAMTVLQESLSSSVNAAAQFAATEAISGKQDAVDKMRAAYEERRNYLVEHLNQIKGMSCIYPEGAFYAFANIKESGMSSFAFANRLIEECQIVTTPGTAFGEAGEGFIRISFASGMPILEEAISRLQRKLGKK